MRDHNHDSFIPLLYSKFLHHFLCLKLLSGFPTALLSSTLEAPVSFIHSKLTCRVHHVKRPAG